MLLLLKHDVMTRCYMQTLMGTVYVLYLYVGKCKKKKPRKILIILFLVNPETIELTHTHDTHTIE